MLVDGTDVRTLEPALLAKTVSLVPQKPYLFSGTVATNLRYGNPDATDEELWHALEVAQAKEFVEELEHGLHAPIAQGGTNVSGGQRQRLAIARTLVQRPEIYLFDDSFSALDYATDAALRRALSQETAEATVVIVAQRVSTIRDADRILVLDEGRVVGSGTHHELMDGNRDLPGDRALPADGSGGRVMAGPGGRMMAGGAPTDRSMDFKGSSKRLLKRFATEKASLYGMLAACVLSVGLSVVGPKILGRATDLVFAGVIGRRMPEGTTKEQAVEGLRKTNSGLADLLSGVDFTPGHGIDFDAVGNVLLTALAVYVGAGLLMLVATRLSIRIINRVVFRLREDIQTKLSRLPLSYFDRAQARRGAQPGDERHRQHLSDDAADDGPAHQLPADHRRRAGR